MPNRPSPSAVFVGAQWAVLGALFAAYLRTGAPGQPLLPGQEHWATALVAAAVLLAAGAALSLGSAVQVSPRPKSGARLITRGVYAKLRHPMYTSVVCLAVALYLRRPSWLTGGASLAVIVFYLLKAWYEERLLVKAYPEYDGYRERTWGVLPFL